MEWNEALQRYEITQKGDIIWGSELEKFAKLNKQYTIHVKARRAIVGDATEIPDNVTLELSEGLHHLGSIERR